jgi:hypothetical protein
MKKIAYKHLAAAVDDDNVHCLVLPLEVVHSNNR